MDGSGAGRTLRKANPLTWSRAARVLLAVAVVVGGLLAFALHRVLSGSWLYFPGYIDPILEEALDLLWLVGLAAWVLMAAAAAALRRRVPDSRVLVHVTIQLYALTIATFVAMSGPFSSAGWMFFLAGSLLGFLLFGPMAFWGQLTFFGVLAVAVVLGRLGLLGELPGGTRPPGVPPEQWAKLVTRTTISSALFAAMTLGLCIYIVWLLRDRERKLERLTKTDTLTGVLNRGYIMRLARVELGRARRHGTPVACVMLDLDHFKRINDDHGHLLGDRVLAEVGEALRSAVREHDLVGRYGGEEFFVLLPNTDLDGGRELAERCRSLLESTVITSGGARLPLTASLGVAAYPDSAAESIDDLLREADAALYRAKQAGRNRVEAA